MLRREVGAIEAIKRNTEYALRALVHLTAEPEKTASAAEIASQQDIPIEYLQKVFQKCARSGLVTSKRGPHGGFSLAKDPAGITVMDVVAAIQGPLRMNRCLLGKGCPRLSNCPLAKKWWGIEAMIAKSMEGLTLQDLVAEMLEAGSQRSK